MMARRNVKQRLSDITLCGRLSILFSALAVAGAVGSSIWAGNSYGLKLAAGILLFVTVAGGLGYFFPADRPSSSSREAN